jgi:MerR family transcriptional regulator, thiopeptide resistance regulator
MEKITVKQLAKMASISSRTLRHYDALGLLPAQRDEANNYRYYTPTDMLRLQQILFYRKLGLSLSDIQTVFNAPDFTLEQALHSHRSHLQKEQHRLQALLQTVDYTLNYLKGESTMNTEYFFKGLTPEEEQAFAEEAAERWDPRLVKQSQQRWKSYHPTRQKEILAEGETIYQELAQQLGKPPESPQVQELMQQWHRHIRYFYEPTVEILRGLGSLYIEDMRFREKFAAIHPELPLFLKQAIEVYTQKLEV